MTNIQNYEILNPLLIQPIGNQTSHKQIPYQRSNQCQAAGNRHIGQA